MGRRKESEDAIRAGLHREVAILERENKRRAEKGRPTAVDVDRAFRALPEDERARLAMAATYAVRPAPRLGVGR
jgi:hypothetical protein